MNIDGADRNLVMAEEQIVPNFTIKASYEAKIRELLCNINSSEVKISSYSSKEFIDLLKSENGVDALHQYVRSSSNCSELLEAWRIQQGKPGMSAIVSLVAAILNHSSGKYDASDHSGRINISSALDKLASSLIKEKIEDVYKELNSTEPKRQKAALFLMTSVVRRGSGLAKDVANSFNFKLPAFTMLADYRYNKIEKRRKDSTRKAFVWFAMSFLESGKPWLLREVIQQKGMYSGVLRGLGNDDDETIAYVLSTLRDRVLIPESLVRPSLRSVLFGSATLELLANILKMKNGGQVAELAHQVLVMVCTDPSNGLMPDLTIPLKGNLKRLLDLMKKLYPAEVDYHKELLLAIVKGRPSFGSAYLDEFPYKTEDHDSPSWFASACLAANLVSAVGTGIFPSTPSSMDGLEVQSFMKCICPRPFSRTVINKGLLHTDTFVKHGTLRLLLECLKLLDSLIGIINTISCSDDQKMHNLACVKQEIQNEVQTLLPDPQVLLKLISSLRSQSKAHQASLKRKQTSDSKNIIKKPKSKVNNEDSDIVIGGISSDLDISMDGDHEKVIDALDEDEHAHQKRRNVVMTIWDFHDSSTSDMFPKDADIHFHAKLLDALKIYIRTTTNMLEGQFDFFMDLLCSPLALAPNLLRSLLSLLMEYIDRPHKCSISLPPLMYKHLHRFINVLLLSPIRDIRDQANGLVHAAMLSTGGFDKSILEIGAWFIFLPGLGGDESSLEIYGNEVLQNLSPVVVSFLCEAVTTVGDNLFKYWDRVSYHIYKSKGIKDMSPDFSPLIICVLQNCLSVLNSVKKTLPEKTIISSYTSNTISYILQSQVDAVLLSLLIESILLEGINDHSVIVNESGDELSEWRPMRKLWLFSQRISCQQPCPLIYSDTKFMLVDNSFATTLGEVQRVLKSRCIDGLAGITKAFSSAIICTTPDEILRNFPLVISISHSLHGVPFSFLSSTLLLEQSLLASVSKLWPDVFFRGLDLALSMNDCNNNDICPSESASAAFSYFLKFIPFHVIFPLMMRIDGQYLKEPIKISDLLLPKLCGRTTDYLISSLRLVLFWAHQIQLSYRIEPLVELEQLSEICVILVERILSNLLDLKPDYDRSTTIVKTIFCHPLVGLYLTHPLGCNEGSENDFEIDLQSSKLRVHKLDHHISSLLKTASGCLLSLCKDENSISQVNDIIKKHIAKSFRAFVQRLFGELRKRFNLCIVSKNFIPLVPTVHALYALIHSVSLYQLLELVHILFSDLNDMTMGDSCTLSALSVVFCIAGATFEVLSNYIKQSNEKRVSYSLFWGTEDRSYSFHVFEKIYYKLYNIATCFDLESANLCLLKAVNVVLSQKYMPDQNFLPLNFVMLRVIETNPIDTVSHFIKKISINKAKLLFAFTELSPLHLSVFGHLFSDILNKDMLKKDNLMDKTSSCAYSDEELIMLLPTALTYLNSAFGKFGKQFHMKFSSIPSVYSKIIFKEFLKWKSYVSRNIFDVERDEFLPSSFDKIHIYVQDTLLGKAVRMFKCHMDLRGDSIKMVKRLKLFDSICPHSTANSGLLDCDVSEMDSYSLSQTSNFINRVVAKISFCKILLFSDDNYIYSRPKEGNGDFKENNLGLESDKADSTRLFFIDVLVTSWQLIAMKLPSSPTNSGKEIGTDCTRLFQFLEDFILRTIVELARKANSILVRLQSIPFIEKLSRSVLLYRFEDPRTLKMLRKVLTSLSEGNFSRVLIYQLVVSHSQFSPAIQSISKTSGSQLGPFSKPVSSILRSLAIPSIDGKGISESAGIYKHQLEIIKLLRVLFTVKAGQGQFGKENEKNITINYRELLLLLLSSYGATVSEIDLEIYSLMHDIEALDGLDSGNIAEMDYLWGSAALKLRIEQAKEVNLSSDSGFITEREDCRKSQFRENLPVDPKLCLATVLYFPYNRTFIYGTLSLKKLYPDILDRKTEAHSFDVKNIQRYDPVFILRFSIHNLSVGYIEPVEFAGLGLLAVVFVSISSLILEIRQLGYEALDRFKSVLERCQKRKDVMQLRLLLSFMQNGIDEPWLKIPSVIAIFAAEASFVLLDPSNDQYSTISKFLMDSPKVNLKRIPLFHNLLRSSSANFKTERLWILRLSCAGLNLEDEAQMYIRDSIFEDLLSFYIDPFSDIESRKLILQLLKKSIKLHKMARYLVGRCGLVPWLSSIISLFTVELCGDQRSSFSSLHNSVIEVVHAVISSRKIIKFMQKNALEQLMDLSSHLYKLLVQGRKFMKENITVLNSVLQILASIIKNCQKRQIFQPHFTIPVEGLFEIQQTVNDCSDRGSGPCTVLGLKLILMTTPPSAINQMNGENLFEFLSWATTTALRSDATQMLRTEKSDDGVSISSEEEPYECLVLKLLRWLTASVIIGKLSGNSNENLDVPTISTLKTLQTLMDRVKNVHGENGSSGFISEDIIATTIVYLQQLVGQDYRILPSVVSALTLLLLPDASYLTVYAGSESNIMPSNRNHVLSLLSRIRSPAEANPSWRWSYYEQWNDHSIDQTDLEKLDEIHACQTLLVKICNELGKKSPDFKVLSYQDVENCGVFKWEKDIIETE